MLKIKLKRDFKILEKDQIILVKDTYNFFYEDMQENIIPKEYCEVINEHEAGVIECETCSNKWVAAAPTNGRRIECPMCRNMVRYEAV